jgi:hypothetical protein
MAIQIEEVEHSAVGPSSFDRVLECPSSAVLGIGLEPVPASFYAAEGTVAHAAFAVAMREGFDGFEMLGEAWVVGEHEIAVDGEMAKALQVALDAAREMAAGGGDWAVEERLALPDTPIWGWPDFLVTGQGPVGVLDFKYGVGIEVPGDVRQVGLYALMALSASAARCGCWRAAPARRCWPAR